MPAWRASCSPTQWVLAPRFSTVSITWGPSPSAAKPSTSSTQKSSGWERIRAASVTGPLARAQSGSESMRLHFFEQCYGVCAQALAAADGAQSLVRSGFHVHTIERHTEVRSKVRADGADVWTELGCLGDDGDVNLMGFKLMRRHELHHFPQHPAAVCAFPLRIRVREMPADVTQGCRAQQRIAKRVQQHVAIRVGLHAFAVDDAHTAQHHVVAGSEGVHVVTVADPHVFSPARCARMASANAMSSGRVILMLSLRPSTTITGWRARSMAPASSLGTSPWLSAERKASMSRR